MYMYKRLEKNCQRLLMDKFNDRRVNKKNESVSEFIDGLLFKKYEMTDKKSNRKNISKVGFIELKRNRGIQMHEYIESMFKSGDNNVSKKRYSDLDDDDIDYIKSTIRTFIEDEKYTLIDTELDIVDNKLKLNGRFDALFYDSRSDNCYLIDWKSSICDNTNSNNNDTPYGSNECIKDGLFGIAKSTEKIRDSAYNRNLIQLLIYKYILQTNYILTFDTINNSSNISSKEEYKSTITMGPKYILRHRDTFTHNPTVRYRTMENVKLILFNLNLDNRDQGPRIYLIPNNSKLILEIVDERLNHVIKKQVDPTSEMNINEPSSSSKLLQQHYIINNDNDNDSNDKKVLTIKNEHHSQKVMDKITMDILVKIYDYLKTPDYLKIDTHFSYSPNNFALNKTFSNTFEKVLIDTGIINKDQFIIKFIGLSYLLYLDNTTQKYHKFLFQNKKLSEKEFETNYNNAIQKLNNTNDHDIIVQTFDTNHNNQQQLYQYLEKIIHTEHESSKKNRHRQIIVILFNRLYFIDRDNSIISIDPNTKQMYVIDLSLTQKIQSKCNQCYNITSNIENINNGKHFCDKKCQLVYYLNKLN